MDLELSFVLILKIFYCACLQTNRLFHIDNTFRDKMCPSTDVAFQASILSAIECVQLCTKSAVCRSLIFYRGNRTCYGLTTERPCAVFTDLPGAVFYKPICAVTATTALVTNETNGCRAPLVVDVPDSGMTSYSYCCNGYEAWNARLDHIRAWTGTWSTNEYLQVDFSTERNITAIVTQGECYYYQWVSSYNVLISSDCVGFTALQTVFTGNFDMETKVTNDINPPVSARCIRIIPLSWMNNPSIRLEVLGCAL